MKSARYLTMCSASSRRSPHGERGLKFAVGAVFGNPKASLPARGAWIEILHRKKGLARTCASLPARGAWIEMIAFSIVASFFSCRSPHGERGLKYNAMEKCVFLNKSLPARGAWIEISLEPNRPYITARRSPHGERGLKYKLPRLSAPARRSLPARGAWIEISLIAKLRTVCACRSPHGERGLKCLASVRQVRRASRRSPHGERGLKSRLFTLSRSACIVAPRTGSVD